jgi:hypothetical protein
MRPTGRFAYPPYPQRARKGWGTRFVGAGGIEEDAAHEAHVSKARRGAPGYAERLGIVRGTVALAQVVNNAGHVVVRLGGDHFSEAVDDATDHDALIIELAHEDVEGAAQIPEIGHRAHAERGCEGGVGGDDDLFGRLKPLLL